MLNCPSCKAKLESVENFNREGMIPERELFENGVLVLCPQCGAELETVKVPGKRRATLRLWSEAKAEEEAEFAGKKRKGWTKVIIGTALVAARFLIPLL